MNVPLAHNTLSGAGDGESFVPLIIESPDDYPFLLGEREREWHEATDAEYQAYEDYWNNKEGD